VKWEIQLFVHNSNAQTLVKLY